MNPLPVLFRDEPVVPRERTAIGLLGLEWRPPSPAAPRRRLDLFEQLLGGPFLEAFDLGIGDDELRADESDTVVVEVPL